MSPKPLTESYIFNDIESALAVEFPSHTSLTLGAKRTDALNTRLYSAGFGPCNGLLIENIDTKQTTLFHFFRGVMSQGHVSMLEKLKQEGGHYRGVFLEGKSSHASAEERPMSVYKRLGKHHSDEDMLCSQHAFIKRYLPDIELQTLRLPYKSWSAGYDAQTSTLHINHWDKLYDPSRADDWGNPFEQTPELNISTGGAKHEGPQRGKGPHK